MKNLSALGLALALSLPFAACKKEAKAPAPHLTRLTPSRGSADTTIIISGAHLAGVYRVLFGPAYASFLAFNDTSLKVLVPSNAVVGTTQVVLLTPGGRSNLRPFRVTPRPTYAQVLTGPTWHLIGLQGFNPAVAGVSAFEDLYAQLPACGKDDGLRFEATHHLTLDEGPTTCPPAAPPAQFGTWTILATLQPRMTLTNVAGFPTDPITVDLVSVAPSYLRFNYPDNSRGPGYTVTRTYSNE